MAAAAQPTSTSTPTPTPAVVVVVARRRKTRRHHTLHEKAPLTSPAALIHLTAVAPATVAPSTLRRTAAAAAAAAHVPCDRRPQPQRSPKSIGFAAATGGAHAAPREVAVAEASQKLCSSRRCDQFTRSAAVAARVQILVHGCPSILTPYRTHAHSGRCGISAPNRNAIATAAAAAALFLLRSHLGPAVNCGNLSLQHLARADTSAQRTLRDRLAPNGGARHRPMHLNHPWAQGERARRNAIGHGKRRYERGKILWGERCGVCGWSCGNVAQRSGRMLLKKVCIL